MSVVAQTHADAQALAEGMDATAGVDLEDSRPAARLGELGGRALATVALVMPGIGPLVAAGPLAAELGELAGHMDPAYQLDDTFSWFVPGLKGDHDFKFGGSYYYLPLHVFDATNLNGTFSFSSSDADFNPANARTYPDRLSIRVPGVSDFFVKGTEVGVFAQDKWKVNRHFTASLGLRYDVEIVKMDNTGNPLFAEGQASPVDTNNLSPRVGGTWTVDAEGRTVVRGGYGLYYQKTSYSNFTPIVSAGAISTSFTVNFPTNQADSGPQTGQFPTDPFLVNGPFVNRDLLAQKYPPGTTTKNTGTVRLDSPDRHLPYSHQASVGVERQIGATMAVPSRAAPDPWYDRGSTERE